MHVTFWFVTLAALLLVFTLFVFVDKVFWGLMSWLVFAVRLFVITCCVE